MVAGRNLNAPSATKCSRARRRWKIMKRLVSLTKCPFPGTWLIFHRYERGRHVRALFQRFYEQVGSSNGYNWFFSNYLTSSYELDTHYEFHDDMEYRHHRDVCRARGASSNEIRSETSRFNLRTSPIPRGSALDKLGV